MGRQNVLLLFTTGRKSGKNYATTLSYYQDGTNYLVVASNWGKETHPDWYLNLLHQPYVEIQVGGKKIPMRAHPAVEEEYERLWKLVTAKNEQYISYQNGIQRKIPIVILVSSGSHPER